MPAKIDAGGAVFTLSLNDQLTKALARAELRIKRMAANVESVGRGITDAGKATVAFGAKVAAVGGAATAAFGKAVFAAGEFEAVVGRFNTVFEDQARSMRQWGKAFSEQIGRSEKVVLDFLASSQDLFVPIGFDKRAALELSRTMTKLAFDLASFRDVTDEQAFLDLQSALTGSGETMKKYSVILNEAGVKQELLNQGIDPKNASNMQKVMARLNIILAGTTKAQGDLLRTSSEFPNRIKSMTAAFEDLSIAIGTPLLEPVGQFVERITNGIRAVTRFVRENEEMVKTAAKIALAVVGAGAAIAAIGAALVAIGSAILGFTTLLAKVVVVSFILRKAFVGLVGLLAVMAKAILTNPLFLLVAGITAATIALVKMSGVADRVAASFGGAFAGIAKSINNVRNAFREGGLQSAVKQARGEVEKQWQLLSLRMQLAWSKAIDSMLMVAENFGSQIAGGISSATAAVSQAVGLMVSSVARSMSEFTKVMAGAFIAVETGLKQFTSIRIDAFGKQFEIPGLDTAIKATGSLSDVLNRASVDLGGFSDNNAISNVAEDLRSAAVTFDSSFDAILSGKRSTRAEAIEDLEKQLFDLKNKEIDIPLAADSGSTFGQVFDAFKNLFSKLGEFNIGVDTSGLQAATKSVVSTNASVAAQIGAFSPSFEADPNAEQIAATDNVASKVTDVVTAVQEVGKNILGLKAETLAGAASGFVADNVGIETFVASSILDFFKQSKEGNKDEPTEATQKEIATGIQKLVNKRGVFGK